MSPNHPLVDNFGEFRLHQGSDTFLSFAAIAVTAVAATITVVVAVGIFSRCQTAGVNNGQGRRSRTVIAGRQQWVAGDDNKGIRRGSCCGNRSKYKKGRRLHRGG